MLALEYEGLAALLADEELRELPAALSGAFGQAPDVDALCGPDSELDDLLANASGECDDLGLRLQVLVADLAKRADAARHAGDVADNPFGALARASEAACRILGKEGNDARKLGVFRCMQSFSLSMTGKLIGDTARSIRLLDRAAETAEAVIRDFPEAEYPELWAKGQFHLAFARGERAAFADAEDESRRILELSVESYEAAMRITTREAAPKDWSLMQSYFAETLINSTQFADESEAEDLLARAVKAMEAALKMLDRKTFLVEWVRSQTALGQVLMTWAEFANGSKRRSLLASAGRTFKEALRCLTKEKEPLPWAHVHGNLAGALLRRAELESREVPRIIENAVESYEKAMQVIDREKYPEQFSMMNAATGGALVELAHLSRGKKAEKYLKRSIDAYEKAIPAVTVEKDPQLWATLRFCLADSLRQLAQECSDDERSASQFRRSAELGEEVLKIIVLQEDMNEIVTMRSFLGMIYAEIAERSGDASEMEEMFERSISSYEEALECCKGEAANRRDEIEDVLSHLREHVRDAKWLGNALGFGNDGGWTLH